MRTRKAAPAGHASEPSARCASTAAAMASP